MNNQPSFVVRGDLESMGWVVRLSHESMGEVPIGPRLAKGTEFPRKIGVRFEKKSDALRACEEWSKWYFAQPAVKKPKKQSAKYVA